MEYMKGVFQTPEARPCPILFQDPPPVNHYHMTLYEVGLAFYWTRTRYVACKGKY